VPPLAPTHVGLIGPFHEGRRRKKSRPIEGGERPV
jgi:hypothetical protein